jgi:competence protein ComEC
MNRGGDGSSDGVAPEPPRARWRFLIVLISLAAVVALAVGLAWRAPNSPFRSRPWPPEGWVLAACDVGQGDGLVLAGNPGTAIVVDTGPDPGKMDDCLTGLGVRHISLILLTHFHADHIDGVPGVLHGRVVDEIETTTVADPPEGAAKVRAWAQAAGVRTSQATAGEKRSYGPVSWDVLWPDPALASSVPPAPGAAKGSGKAKAKRKGNSRTSHSSRTPSHGGDEGSGPNNASVVLHIRSATRDGPVTMLLTGDIEPPAQQALLAAHPDLASDIFKVPHHGSTYQDPDLVAAVRPRASIISVGAGNTYGHPAARTLTLAASTGARVFRTDRDGTVVVVGPASRLEVVLRK